MTRSNSHKITQHNTTSTSIKARPNSSTPLWPEKPPKTTEKAWPLAQTNTSTGPFQPLSIKPSNTMISTSLTNLNNSLRLNKRLSLPYSIITNLLLSINKKKLTNRGKSKRRRQQNNYNHLMRKPAKIANKNQDQLTKSANSKSQKSTTHN